MIKFYCIEKNCNNEICYKTWKYGKKRCHSCANRINSLGQIFTQKHRSNISKSKKGLKLSKKHKQNLSKALKGKNRGKNNGMFKKSYWLGKKRPKLSKQMLGNKRNYIHGKGYEPYSIKFNNKLKESIHKRDNYTCQNCGMTRKEHFKQYNRKLDVHHINYNKKNCKEDNLITLCKKCNLRANSNRDYWFAYFTYIIEE